jgi:hypothetical protein
MFIISYSRGYILLTRIWPREYKWASVLRFVKRGRIGGRCRRRASTRVYQFRYARAPTDGVVMIEPSGTGSVIFAPASRNGRSSCMGRPPERRMSIPGLTKMRNHIPDELRIFHDAPQNLAFDKSGGVFRQPLWPRRNRPSGKSLQKWQVADP